MNKALKPLTLSEITFGKEYLYAELWYNHGFQTNLNTIAFAKELPADFIGRRAMVTLKGQTKERYLSGFGLIPEKSIYLHRVFENTPENFSELKQLLSDEKSYLLAIGFTEESATAKILKLKNGPKTH
jgi:hypothetical protein